MLDFLKKILNVKEEKSIEYHSINRTDYENYFETMGEWAKAKNNTDFSLAADLAVINAEELPAFVQYEVNNFGSFKIKTIPALEDGAKILSLLGRKDDLIYIRNIIEDIPELSPWILKIDQQIENVDLFKKIVDVISKNHTIIQSDIKHLVGCNDGHRIANLCFWLEKAGKIIRIKKDGSYLVKMVDKNTKSLISKAEINVESHRIKNKTIDCIKLDLESIPCISLPKAPYYWEARNNHEGKNPDFLANDNFEIISKEDLSIISIEALSNDEKPDPAFRKIYKTAAGVLIVDDLGNSRISNDSPASVMYYNKQGKIILKNPIEFDMYRIGTNPHNKSFIAMSKEGVIHAYDYLINPLLLTSVQNYPEVIRLIKKFDIEKGRLKNYIRSVSLSSDNTRYILTCVDEVWCITLTGECLWGAKLPIKEGYQKVSSSDNINTSKEIEDALKTMELQFPLTNEQIKNRYKELAKIWHPDLNQGSEKAKDRMQKINFAIEALLGGNIEDIQNITSDIYVSKQSSQKISIGNIEITASIEYSGDASFAADWIYASAFSENNHNIFIGGYSGKIVELDSNGSPIRMYDIGSAPEEIIPTNDYLYILTKTRLYILQNSSLINLIDVYKEGKIIVAQNGFGLLQDKKLQWFKKDGEHVGDIITQAPIRRVYYSSKGLIIETRTHRAIIDGIYNWWE